jgi:catechol 2,3-dioxygenase-like lactoylglutathione lyase family enzyme
LPRDPALQHGLTSGSPKGRKTCAVAKDSISVSLFKETMMDICITLVAADKAAFGRFYDAVLGVIGWRPDHALNDSRPGWRGYRMEGEPDGFSLWIRARDASEPAGAPERNHRDEDEDRDGDEDKTDTSLSANARRPDILVGFPVSGFAEVEAFRKAVLDAGGTDGTRPGTSPDRGPTWLAARCRDPFGNSIAAVYNG